MILPPAPVAQPKQQALKKTAQFIASQQLADGAIPWFEGGKLDPWDHTEAAMGLSVAGFYEQAEHAYHWLKNNQLDDGSWYANYFNDEQSSPRETNFVAYPATGVWHHYLITNNRNFLQNMFPTVERAINFVVCQQSEHGDIAWAVDEQQKPLTDSLITGCSSILRSLECAIFCAQVLDIEKPEWQAAGAALKQALEIKPYRFDRNWQSKARFAMDWYYPILAGICNGDEAKERLQKRWQEFVKPHMGCRCVNDEPWVTMAETSELVMALVAAKDYARANELFLPLENWSTEEGAYWTGYVYKDDTIWPEETTTWTAGAVLLATDALHHLTPAHRLFTNPSYF